MGSLSNSSRKVIQMTVSHNSTVKQVERALQSVGKSIKSNPVSNRRLDCIDAELRRMLNELNGLIRQEIV